MVGCSGEMLWSFHQNGSYVLMGAFCPRMALNVMIKRVFGAVLTLHRVRASQLCQARGVGLPKDGVTRWLKREGGSEDEEFV